MNGGWLLSDLGSTNSINGDGIDIWSGTITLTGAATTNIIDVNDAGTPPALPEVHCLSGTIQGTGGFSKVNTGSLNLMANNTLEGDVFVQRGGPGGAGLTAKGSVTDSGATLLQKGGGGIDGTTDQTLVVGVFGGVNNIADHFMTFDKASPTELRPLDVATEYLSSRALGHTLSVATLTANDAANPYNKNLNIDYNPGNGLDPDVDWYGDRPIRLTNSVGANSLRFGTNTPTSTANSQNTNELGSALVLDAGSVLYLGDSLAANTGLATNTDGSGMILFGRDINGTAPGSNQFIAGGALDFGSREAIFVNESSNSALIRSEIRGSGGLTKAGANNVYLDNANSYTGTTNVAEGLLLLRNDSALGGSARVNIEGNGALYLELGTSIVQSTINLNPPDLFVGAIDASRYALYSNSANNTWGGDIIIDTVDALGNWVYTPYIGANALATLNIDGDIYSNELANPINRDTVLNDSRQMQIVFNAAGGVVNLNGQVRDNALGGGGGVQRDGRGGGVRGGKL